jgi:hypothetical protein
MELGRKVRMLAVVGVAFTIELMHPTASFAFPANSGLHEWVGIAEPASHRKRIERRPLAHRGALPTYRTAPAHAPGCPGLYSWNPANPDRGFCDPGFAYHGNVNGCVVDQGYGRWISCDALMR